MSVIPPEVRTMIEVARFYVVFQDGTWRTASNKEWGEEQIWKLKPARMFWFGGPEALIALELVYARCLQEKDTSPSQ